MSKTSEKILEILNSKLGILLIAEKGDFALSDYLTDSIAFIRFIVCLEEEFNVELPDEFLNIELLESFAGFSDKMDCFLNNNKQ